MAQIDENAEAPDTTNSVIIRRHDDTVYAIPLAELEKYKVDQSKMTFDEQALVQTLGCYNCRSKCSS